MKLLSVKSAKSILLIPTDFLNPRGKNLAPIIAGFVERYQFAIAPQASTLAAQPLELKFESGSFKDLDGPSLQVNLTIYGDGLLAETKNSTEASDRFLQEALTWLSETYTLPFYRDLNHEQLYTSELAVELALPQNIFSEKFANFVHTLKRGLSHSPGLPFEFSNLYFGPDPQTTKRTAQFRVERLLGISYEKQQYYSAAPLPTDEHLQLLIAMEEAASG